MIARARFTSFRVSLSVSWAAKVDGSGLSTLSPYETLRDEAKAAVEDSGMQKQDIAQVLDCMPSAISQAIRLTGTKYASLQRRIIGYLTDYQVKEEPVEVTFRVLRKETDQNAEK